MKRKFLLPTSIGLNILLIIIITAVIIALFITGILPPFSSTNDSVNTANEIDTSEYKYETIAKELEIPWAITFVNNEEFLVTERTGKVIKVMKDGSKSTLLDLTEDIVAVGESGLMGMEKDPNFEENKYIYIFHSYRNTNEEMKLKVVRYTYEETTLNKDKDIITNLPAGNIHSSGEISFGPDDKLYITTGDVGNKKLSQDPSSLAGKTLRINKDGSIPDDNPFITDESIRDEIYSLGHRNAQGLDWHPLTKQMYQSEHGPSGFDGGTGQDEINVVLRGLNYGWPEITGKETSNLYQEPLLSYTPAIAPASLEFYTGDIFPELENHILVAGLRGETIIIIDPLKDNEREVGQIADGDFGRIREIRIGPDGAIYFTTSNTDGRGTPREGDDKVIRVYK